MIRNYFRTTLRALLKNGLFTSINIIGLALGMAASLAIFHYVSFEVSYDNFHKSPERTFRVELKREFNGQEYGQLELPMPLVDAMKEAPEYESSVRFVNIDYQNNSVIYRSDNDVSVQEVSGVFYTDNHFDQILNFEFVNGSLDKFDQPNKIILTETLARNLFNELDPIERTVQLSGNNGANEYEVIAVLQDLPENTHFDFSLLLSMPSYVKIEGVEALESWDSWNGATFFQIKEENQLSRFHQRMDEVILNQPSIKEDDGNWRTELDPLTSLHLDDNNSEGFKALGDKKAVLALKVIGIFILIIAWINYINLSTAQVTERAREVGVRKVLGSSISQLRIQFLLEAVVLNLAAAILAFTFVQIALPYLRNHANAMIISEYQFVEFWTLVTAVLVAGSLLSGTYPAFVLSSYKTSKALSGKSDKGKAGFGLRKFLVVFQFACSIILIAGTITIYKQIRFMKSADLGLSIDNILVLNAPPGALVDNNEFFNQLNNFKQELLKYSFVDNMTTSSMIPGTRVTWGTGGIKRINGDTEMDRSMPLIACDKDFHETYDIDLVAGRYYRDGDNTWRNGEFVINEQAAEMLGFENADEAIGSKLTGGRMFPELTVIGVVKNVHHRTLQAERAPLAFVKSVWSNYYSIKLNHNESEDPASQLSNLKGNIEELQTIWAKFFPDAPFDYYFLDKAFNDQYKSDEEFGFIFLLFASLAVIIASMGLLGLSAKSIAQRTKEIGIRKVLGATVSRLTVMLSKEYFILVVISGFIAIPVAFYLLSIWLESYAYKVSLEWWVGLIPLMLVIVFSLVVVGMQTVRAASKNPVDSLKYE